MYVYLLQYIKIDLEVIEHNITSPQRQTEVFRFQILDVLVHISSEQRCYVRLQHVVVVIVVVLLLLLCCCCVVVVVVVDKWGAAGTLY